MERQSQGKRCHKMKGDLRRPADTLHTSMTTMASWLVPFLPCRVNRQTALPTPLPAILPGTSSSVVLPSRSLPRGAAPAAVAGRCSAVRHDPIDSARTTSCRQSRHPLPPPPDGAAVATVAAVAAAVVPPLSETTHLSPVRPQCRPRSDLPAARRRPNRSLRDKAVVVALPILIAWRKLGRKRANQHRRRHVRRRWRWRWRPKKKVKARR